MRDLAEPAGPVRVLDREEGRRTAAKSLEVRGEHHVLSGTAGIELGVFSAGDLIDSECDHRRRRGEVAGIGTETREPVADFSIADEDEPPWLAVPG